MFFYINSQKIILIKYIKKNAIYYKNANAYKSKLKKGNNFINIKVYKTAKTPCNSFP